MLILVDGLDREVGAATKLQAHVNGVLHRAFSVVLVRDGEEGPEILLAKRSLLKYHSGGLWANSCCSHPRVGEDVVEAAYRRVPEELGCEAADLREVCAFVYRAEFDNGLCEYEYDHVIVGRCEGTIDPDPAEASEVRHIIPISEGGKHDKSNIMAVCRECHDEIHRRMREEKKDDSRKGD
jgi:isopentenyl-diphosphate delta-isomerase